MTPLTSSSSTFKLSGLHSSPVTALIAAPGTFQAKSAQEPLPALRILLRPLIRRTRRRRTKVHRLHRRRTKPQHPQDPVTNQILRVINQRGHRKMTKAKPTQSPTIRHAITVLVALTQPLLPNPQQWSATSTRVVLEGLDNSPKERIILLENLAWLCF